MVKFPPLLELAQPLMKANKLRLINVYIREAHPTDGWRLDENDSGVVSQAALGVKRKICYTQTKTLDERISVANDFMEASKAGGLDVEGVQLVVDDPATEELNLKYEAAPEKLVYVHNGKVLFATGQGPFQYSLKGLARFLETQHSKM